MSIDQGKFVEELIGSLKATGPSAPWARKVTRVGPEVPRGPSVDPVNGRCRREGVGSSLGAIPGARGPNTTCRGRPLQIGTAGGKV